MLALDLTPASFDAVIGMYSIIHLPRTEQVEMLRKIVTWLKPGGLLLANFAAEEEAGKELHNWLKQEKGWMFWSGWGSDRTVQMVKEVGLEVILEDVVEDVVGESHQVKGAVVRSADKLYLSRVPSFQTISGSDCGLQMRNSCGF